MSIPNRWLRRGHLAAIEGVGWGRFVRLFLLVFTGGLAVLALFVLAVDPYDSGRFPSLGLRGIADGNPQTAAVSRGRDPRFDAAVIGNSRAQLLDPARLSQGTGFRFVQLTVQGTTSREQLAMLHWFLRRPAGAAAIVLVVDEHWCGRDPALPSRFPFPFWLYGDSDLDYLLHLFNAHAVDRAFRRVAVALGLREGEAADGYYNYEDGRAWNFRPAIPDRIVPVEPPAADPPLRFPAIEALEALLGEQNFAGPLWLVMPPVFFTDLPRPGSAEAHATNRCKARLRALAAARPRTVMLDFYLDTPETRDPRNFMDASHYRAVLARRIERRIATVHAPAEPAHADADR